MLGARFSDPASWAGIILVACTHANETREDAVGAWHPTQPTIACGLCTVAADVAEWHALQDASNPADAISPTVIKSTTTAMIDDQSIGLASAMGSNLETDATALQHEEQMDCR